MWYIYLYKFRNIWNNLFEVKITIEINGQTFEAEGDYIPTVLDKVLHEAGVLEEEENVFFLDKGQQKNYYRYC